MMRLSIRFVRHGLTAWNEANRYLGKTDVGLSEKGRTQLGQRREGAMLFVGSMRRCRETAAILFPGQTGICIPEWTEIDFGEFEGKSFEELKADQTYQAWLKSGGTMPFPQGESREAFIARSMKGYERMLEYVNAYQKSCGENGEMDVTAVVNGGTLMAVCSSLFGGEYFDYQIGCGGEYQCPAVLL